MDDRPTLQRFKRLILVLVLLLVTAVTAGALVPAETRGAAQAETDKKKEAIKLIRTESLDRAGEEVSRRVDDWSERAARQIGGWISARAVLDITWMKLFLCLAILFAVVSAERILRILIHLRTRPTPGDAQEPDNWQREMLQALSGPLSLFILIYGVYGAMAPLFSHFQGAAGRNLVQVVAQKAADMGGTVALFWFLFRLVGLLDGRLKRWAAGTESTLDDMLVPIVGKTLRIFIAVIGVIIVVQNLTGLEIGPLLASLGIGGLAVALAAKETIANFFGTLTILFDKPFQVGQRVVADGYDGTVEAVGFRSTRIRTLTGHLVTIPNEKVVNTTLENIGSRPYIRWMTNIGITYDTSPEKVEQAVAILREILADHEGMNADLPPRVFFNGFNDWSLNIFVIAWYHPPDYWAYQAWLERTCLGIMTRFRQEGIDFAFPSRTLYLAGDDKRRLSVRFSEEKGSGTKPTP